MRPQQQQSAASAPAVPGDQRGSRYRYVIGGLTVLLNLSFGLSFPAIAPVTPLILEEYGISRGMVGLLTGSVILMMSAFAIPAGMLVGRVGLKKLIGVAWFMAAAPALSFLADGFPALLAMRMMFGLSLAVILPAFGPLLMQWFRPRELPLINGLNLAMTAVGIALSTFITAPLGEAVGWKTVLSIYGAVALVGAFLWMWLARVQQPVQSGGRLSIREMWSVLRDRTTLLLALADAGPFAPYIALTTWLPTFYYEVHGMSLSAAGSAVGLAPLAGVAALILAGVLSMRVVHRRPFLIIPGVVGGLAGFATFLLAGSGAIYPALLLLGFGGWFYLPMLFTIPMEAPGAVPERVSLVLATIGTLGGFLSFVAPLAVGILTDALGSYIPGFMIFAVLSWSLVIAGVMLPETGRPRT
ncbi:MAG: MFS transporter [Chloroflexi bacterium]|nr:MFS transporter [Chloroflexota bacterium]